LLMMLPVVEDFGAAVTDKLPSKVRYANGFM
jgi:hypothetical protein